MNRLLLILLIGIFSCPIFSQDWKVYPYEPAGQVAFPVDEGRHTSEPIEWWYTAGHLLGQTSGTNYSYMYTFFHYPQAGFDGFRILNITNDDTGEFFQDVLPLNYTTLSTTGFDVEASVFLAGTEYWKNKLDGSNQPIPFEYELFAANGTGGLSLDIVTTKRPLILGDDGFLNQGLANYTYYFSQTKNDITGTLTFQGVTENVVGTGWIDRQYGDFNPLTGEKYEWFSMQLSNGMDINLWNIFTADRTIPDEEEYRILSAYVDESTQYTTDDLQIERLQFFCTPDEVMCYSKQWRLTSTTNHSIDLTISTLHTTTEVQLPFRFFEGATTISGTIDGQPVTGIGFAELLHAYEDPDIEITSPAGGVYDTSVPISWQLNNPDEGRPVYYDLEYSIDNQANFLPIVSDITDTNYLWSNPPISNNDEVWFRITAHSIDGTLTSTITSDSASSATLSVSNSEVFQIQLHPNPVDEKLNLLLSDAVANGEYQIFDIEGRVVSESVFNDTSLSLNVSHLNSGLYFIRIVSDRGVLTEKFIKR
ncbi:lipocalin-like domain-containing protein [Winogradskyella sp. 3972H.M.0a.05]|uniref:lipocalin-like domain-containing protein n=1 Tax=Winogradskyella sp. 3972H.M.0a.05 TaxID=2950277 RepID=UPI0033947314